MHVKLLYEVASLKTDTLTYIMGGGGGFIFDHIWMLGGEEVGGGVRHIGKLKCFVPPKSFPFNP